MDFRILGPLEVSADGRAVPLAGAKPRAVLAMLLLHPNEPVSAESLAAALWGEDAPAGATADSPPPSFSPPAIASAPTDGTLPPAKAPHSVSRTRSPTPSKSRTRMAKWSTAPSNRLTLRTAPRRTAA
jgi:hypothetical protein